MSQRKLKILTFTTLFPSAARPRHGIFVETRLSHFRRVSGAELRVVAPVPWFPSTAAFFGEYALFARTPRREVRDGVDVHHPRYLTLPGVGMHTQPYAIAQAAAGCIARLTREGFDFDLIDAHYLYPDGVAAAMLAQKLAKPLMLTARGSDVNLLMQFRAPRRMILRALSRAQGIVAVSAALKRRLVELGAEGSRIRVLRNGVDTGIFHPVPMAEARAALDLGTGPVFASVGNLVPEKGHDLAMGAVAMIPEATLLIVGDGPERQQLAQRARAFGIAERVRFLPVRPQRELPAVYGAADALVLASSREGWPNVVLEAMACGTPVVATAVGGVPEILADSIGGVVVPERSASALAAGMRSVMDQPPKRESVRAWAARFGWEEVAHGQVALCREILASGPVSDAQDLAPMMRDTPHA
jgi:teichuronic acid biosynthesis glycosyltransferase TuaC